MEGGLSVTTDFPLNSTVVVLYSTTIVLIDGLKPSLRPSLVRRPPFRIASRRCDCYPC